jgi:xylitol oxidase
VWVPVTNWGGNVTFGAATVRAPESVAELAELITAAERVRVLGTGHSFNRIADTDGILVSLSRLPASLSVAPDRGTVRVGAGMTLARLADGLHRAGLALPTMPSLPHITVAGACATATHGSGDSVGTLASAVRAVRLLNSAGSPVEVAEPDPDFGGVVVSLGALGVVTELELAVQPGYEIAQRVYDGLAWDALVEQVDDILASAYSVSVFTTIAGPSRVWVKRRAGDPEVALPGVRPADGAQHPVRGADPINCTDQSGAPGPWHQRLPHFRAEFAPSTGAELQSEFLVGRADAAHALRALKELAALIVPVALTIEVRSVGPEEHWLSSSYRRPSVGLHFTWRPDPATVWPVLTRVEHALRPLRPRPHWGKLFTASAAELSTRYPRWPDFRALRQRLDPAHRFGNLMLDGYFPA